MKSLARVLGLPCIVACLSWSGLAAQQVPGWGDGLGPFAFAFIGDMPYGRSTKKK